MTSLVVLLSLVCCAEDTVSDFDETYYSDSDVTEADEPEETVSEAETEDETESEVTFTDSEISEFCAIMDFCANVAPGTAGSSLRSVSAAASLLDWAEFHKYVLSEYAITALLNEWQAGCEDFDWEFECLTESWESVVGSIEEIISDPTDESLLGLLDDAGYTLQYDEYDEDLAEMVISAIESFIAQ